MISQNMVIKHNMKKIDNLPLLSNENKKHIQKLVGRFIYKAQAVDNTTLHSLNKISITETGATLNTMKYLEHFLDYCVTNPEAEIIYMASDRQLIINSDAMYLVAQKSRSRPAGYHYIGNRDGKLFNGPIYIISKVIKSVMTSAAEAEYRRLFINTQDTVPLIITLLELGHPQSVIPLKTDNSIAEGIMNQTI